MNLLFHFFFFLPRMDSMWRRWMLALLVSLTWLHYSGAQDRDSPEDFVIQAKADCYFTNGTEQVRFVVRFIFNLEECLHFDSDLGHFVALTELGRPDAEAWNRRPDILERSRASVDLLCRRNYKLGVPFTVGRKGFYPGDLRVRWLRNGQAETAGVMSTGLIRNGDWTFQTTEMLEMTPELGDIYTCLVDHPSLLNPISVEWRAQVEHSWAKMLSGVAGFLLGLIFFLVGIITYLRAWKGCMETQRSAAEVSRAGFPSQPY
ncbi:HLA class II histocompatibility antigen, DO beta chain isoform X4 [Ochotona princeps]|uniref:HLA class II histocompatibility antigen, DO beta chain isoform X4 n=1 Tax=Ochotona princeps TaxID=9978 RepID=UPI0027155868|nr:HLA class II histocompatibility antigen, DO beta chain isoform X4 [Ochotona princeps]